jgi:hypothetical protein
MGTSKRLAWYYDKLMDERIQRSLMAGPPLSLTPEELELDKEPLTRTPTPIEGWAWIRYGENAMKLQVRIVAWTERAVAVKWDAPGGEHKAWVWASAVRRRDP